MPVASAEAPILAMLLPSSSAPISRSRLPTRSETTAASLLPCFDSRSMLAREAPVSAVSLAEKNAETKRQPTRITNVNQSMTGHHFAVWKREADDSKLRISGPGLELARQKIAH